MANVIKLRKGLDINLKGRADRKKVLLEPTHDFAVKPTDFIGVVPKLMVREGDSVKAGDTLFINKNYPNVKFASPVSGTVAAIVRGERRKLLQCKLIANTTQEFSFYGVKAMELLSGEEVVEKLLNAGIFGMIKQLPYAVSANADVKPKSIFVSALRDMPLSCDFDYELESNEKDFQTGLTALSKVAKTYLGIGKHQTSPVLTAPKDVEITVFDGSCPAGNVGVQVNHIDPVNKGELIWTVDPTTVIFIGRLFNKGIVDLTRTIAIAGSEITNPSYAEVRVGQSLQPILNGRLNNKQSVRIIQGNPLTGSISSQDDYLGAYTSEITAIPEGNNANEMFGWIMPRFSQFSTSRSYFSWLMGKRKEYSIDARIKGGERHIIMSGEYDKVLPMDIYGEYLIKAIIAGDIDRMEQLGIYEISPEDFALAEFVDSSKLELQRIVREGLDMLRKENS